MRIFCSLALVLLGACASAASDHTPGDLQAALRADLFRGGEVDLNAALAAGRPVALVYWQAWCGSCVAEAPLVEAAHRQLGDRIEIVGVVSGPDSAVDEAKLQARIFELGLTYGQIRDRDLALTRLFEVTGTPTIVILNPSGEVVYQDHEVPESWDAFL